MTEYIKREEVLQVVSQIMRDCKIVHKGRAINRKIRQLPTMQFNEDNIINSTYNLERPEDELFIRCKDCKYLMFSDCYGECSKAIKGIVMPDDFCPYGERGLK